MIDDEHAGQQLDFMIEKLEGDRARKERGVHKDASAESNIIGDRSWLAEKECGRGVGQR